MNTKQTVTSVFLFLSGILFLVPGCVTEKPNNSGSKQKQSRIGEDLQEKHRAQLKKLFRQHKRAIVNGDIQTLQELYRLPGNEKISLKELKDSYQRHGGRWASMYRGARLAKEMEIFVYPARSNQYPDAVFQGIVPQRLTNGNTAALAAVYINETWKLLPPPVFVPDSDENN